MHNDVTGINQNPIALIGAFCLCTYADGLKIVDNVIRHRTDLAGRSARSNNHVICDGGFANKFDVDDVESFIVLEGRCDAFDRLLQVDRS